MTLDTFWAHKEGITEAMRSSLIMSKHLNKPMHDYCEYIEHIVVTINKGKDKDLSELQEIQHLLDEGYELNVDGDTKQEGRYDYFRCVHFKFSKKLLRDKIKDTQIEDAMIALLKKEMGLTYYAAIECKVMSLFKEGKIDWDDVIKTHTTDYKM